MDQFAGIILDVATRLLSCTKAQAADAYNLEQNMDSLKQKWHYLQNKEKDVQIEIQRAESTGVMKGTYVAIGWLQDVRNLGQEINKNIPDIQDGHNNKCVIGYCPKNCVLSYKLGKKTVKILARAEELVTRADSMDVVQKLPPKPVDEMPYGETVGLDLMVHKVWNSIEDDNVGIIGLYGMGGVGKTTLMKIIRNEFGKREHHFDPVLWVEVSRDHDINKIMNDISNKLGIDDDSWNRSSQDQRVTMIYRHLKQKKFVLILDDLWEKLELEKVGVPYPKDTNNKSKVLFATRSEDVCAKMQAQKKFKVECLLEQEAFDLFCRKVDDKTLKCHPEIPKLAEEMAKECKGLPLALITVGSSMAGVEGIEAWRQAKKDLRSCPWTSSDLEDKVFSVLELSYDKLPDETHKSCFRYCALYPKDREIDADDLIDRWIGEGFLGKDTNKKSVYDMLEEGKSIIEKLKLSSLIEGTKYYPNWGSGIKMHDVICDMALWLARDKNKNKDKVLVQGEALAMSEMDSERLKVVERISVIDSDKVLDVAACPNLITLCLRLLTPIVNDYSNLQSMERLKVLDLTGYSPNDQVPSEIGELINLEFLNLSGIDIQKKLPIELKNLKKLRIFLMEYARCGLAIIPLEVIENLKQLKVFRFTTLNVSRELIFKDFEQDGKKKEAEEEKKEYEEAFLEKLESLPKLEELGIQLTTTTGVHKLLHSSKLKDCSRHFKLYKVGDDVQDKRFDARDNLYDDVPLNKLEKKILLAKERLDDVRDQLEKKLATRDQLLVSLPGQLEMKFLLEKCSRMKHLDRISLSFVRDIKDSSVNDTFHLGNLRLVQIECCHSITHLTWLKYAPRLESIDVIDCNSIEEVVMVKEGEDGDGDIFPNLIHLRLMGLPRLKRIHKRALGFPSLKYIIVSNCPNLRKLPFNSSFASKDNLITFEGEDKWWKKLQWEDTDTSIKHLLNSKLQSLRF